MTFLTEFVLLATFVTENGWFFQFNVVFILCVAIFVAWLPSLLAGVASIGSGVVDIPISDMNLKITKATFRKF